MSCNSAIYASNQASQTLPVGSIVNFGNIVRRFGKNLNLSGGNVMLRNSGYYFGEVNVTFTAGGAGIATITVLKDGLPITGANASITAVSGNTYSVSIPFVVRDLCCVETSITAVTGGVAMTATNASISVLKI